MIFTNYLLFCSAILNNAMCIVSHDMFPIGNGTLGKISHMNISRIGYTRLDIDLLFCHICMTAVHKAKWLASMKARLSLAQPSLPNFYLHKKEVTAAFKQYKAL